MSGTNIRVIDLPDLGTVTDASSFVIDKGAATGRFSALAVKNYCGGSGLPEAPSTNQPYGRMNGAWTPVVPDAPSNGLAFGRLNGGWSAVLPEAPVNGTTYGRLNGTYTPVLPITGGTVQGNLGATGNVTAGGHVYTNVLLLSAAASYEWAFFLQGGTGHHIQQHRAGWYDLWAATDGTRNWVGPAGIQMSLSPGGNLTILGSFSASGDIYGHDFIGHAGLFSSGVYVNSLGDTNYFGMFYVGGTKRMQFADHWYWDWNGSTGTLIWVSNDVSLWVMRQSPDNFSFNPSGPVGGNGPYQNVSDRRFKSNIVPATAGLAEIIQLQPVTFDRLPITDANGNPVARPSEIGFIADDVQPIIPEAVYRTVWPDVGQADPSDPALSLASECLTAVLVNAVKELNARLVTLEGAA